ncbi:hypothetical protein FSP39_010698 [Pinctada imbricata]|uniref:Uncharacterized protein n=1 Tax=Pinctada imbricata TaxID=66713 RepID=A0AA89BTE2_PINIB|nr:hypothetical protein FSP39_010698 [Pinctada imbricata]
MSHVGGVKLPPIGDRRGHDGAGFSQGMITQINQQSLIYRSVPPKGVNFTFTDMLSPGVNPAKTQGRATVVSSNAPSEFAERFKARPTTKPKVVDFDPGHVNSESKGRRVSGFFPPVKLRRSNRVPVNEHGDSPLISTSKMQLAPTGYTEVRTKSSRSFNRTPPVVRKTPESVRTNQTAPEVSIIYPSVLTENLNYDDISMLPPPKRILPRRELPWVFRYKVKRNMNELAKIMASKPGSTTTTPIPPDVAADITEVI